MRPIETVFKGYRFKSRLKARWAVFYDALGIPFQYEPETFELPGELRYTPDFWLPDHDCWVTMKNADPTRRDEMKARLLSEGTNKNVFIFVGEPWIPEAGDESGILFAPGTEYIVNDEPLPVAETGPTDASYWWCECRHCGALGLEFNGRSARLPCRGETCPEADGNGDKDYNYDSPRLVQAYTKARQARFKRQEG